MKKLNVENISLDKFTGFLTSTILTNAYIGYWIIVHTLGNQLLQEPSVLHLDTLQVCYRQIEDVYEEV